MAQMIGWAVRVIHADIENIIGGSKFDALISPRKWATVCSRCSYGEWWRCNDIQWNWNLFSLTLSLTRSLSLALPLFLVLMKFQLPSNNWWRWYFFSQMCPSKWRHLFALFFFTFLILIHPLTLSLSLELPREWCSRWLTCVSMIAHSVMPNVSISWLKMVDTLWNEVWLYCKVNVCCSLSSSLQMDGVSL